MFLLLLTCIIDIYKIMNNKDRNFQFWQRVKTELLNKKLKQEYLADKLNMSLSALQSKMSRTSTIDVFLALEISKILNVPLLKLLLEDYQDEKYEKIKQDLKIIRNSLNNIESHF